MGDGLVAVRRNCVFAMAELDEIIGDRLADACLDARLLPS